MSNTISDYLEELITQKSALAANLTTKGVAASSSEKLNTLVPKVLEIEGGTRPVLETLSANQNGTYLPESGVDGFDAVIISVPTGDDQTYAFIALSVPNEYDSKTLTVTGVNAAKYVTGVKVGTTYIIPVVHEGYWGIQVLDNDVMVYTTTVTAEAYGDRYSVTANSADILKLSKYFELVQASQRVPYTILSEYSGDGFFTTNSYKERTYTRTTKLPKVLCFNSRSSTGYVGYGYITIVDEKITGTRGDTYGDFAKRPSPDNEDGSYITSNGTKYYFYSQTGGVQGSNPIYKINGINNQLGFDIYFSNGNKIAYTSAEHLAELEHLIDLLSYCYDLDLVQSSNPIPTNGLYKYDRYDVFDEDGLSSTNWQSNISFRSATYVNGTYSVENGSLRIDGAYVYIPIPIMQNILIGMSFSIDPAFTPNGENSWYNASCLMGRELSSIEQDFGVLLRSVNGELHLAAGYDYATISQVGSHTISTSEKHEIFFLYTGTKVLIWLDGELDISVTYTARGKVPTEWYLFSNGAGDRTKVIGNIYSVNTFLVEDNSNTPLDENIYLPKIL